MIVVPSADARVLALCDMLGHPVDTFDSVPDGPGADVCREDGCESEMMLSLHQMRLALAKVRADLVCSCPSDPECRCYFEHYRIAFSELSSKATNDIAVMAGPYVNEAEAILRGVQ